VAQHDLARHADAGELRRSNSVMSTPSGRAGCSAMSTSAQAVYSTVSKPWFQRCAALSFAISASE